MHTMRFAVALVSLLFEQTSHIVSAFVFFTLNKQRLGNRLDKKLTIKALKTWKLDLKKDSNDDHLSHYFENDQPCSSGSNMLQD